MKAPIIRVDNITKIFGKHVVLNEVSLDIPQDKIFGIIGESGSGKTTLLKLLIGFMQPEEGQINFEGKKVSENMHNIRERMGFATQDNCFYPKLTVKENIKFYGVMYGIHKDDIIDRTKKLLKFIDLEDAADTISENLSSGMQRRLDIACSLIHNPKVLIMDEPTQDLDPVLRKEIVRLIKRINEEGTTVILTSHLLFEAEILCDQIAILHKGKILEVGSPNQLKSLYSKNQEIHLETYPGNYEGLIKILKQDPNIKAISKRGHKLVIYTPQAEKILRKILLLIEKSRQELVDVDVRKPSLDEVFESLIKKK